MKEKKLDKIKNWIDDHAEQLAIAGVTVSSIAFCMLWYKIGVESGKDIACDILGNATESMEAGGFAKFFNPCDGTVVDYPTAAELWLESRK